jgi:hypothetical protein
MRASVSLNSNDPGGNKAPPPLAPAEHLSESRPARWPTRSCCQRGVHGAAGCTPGAAYGAVFSEGLSFPISKHLSA